MTKKSQKTKVKIDLKKFKRDTPLQIELIEKRRPGKLKKKDRIEYGFKITSPNSQELAYCRITYNSDQGSRKTVGVLMANLASAEVFKRAKKPVAKKKR